MGFGPEAIARLISEYSAPLFTILGFVFQILIILGVLYWAYIIWRFDTKLLISEMGKNRKVINQETRAIEFLDKKTKVPKLRTFGYLGFAGEVIEKPPAECLTPYKSRLTTKMYHFVKKDGLYHPIQNYVLGKEITKDSKGNPLYGIEGTGLEVNRDYNAEEGIYNRLENAAIKYRNKDQRNQMYLSYGLMIVSFIVAGVIMVYTINKIGGLSTAIENMREPIQQGIENVIQNKIGPG